MRYALRHFLGAEVNDYNYEVLLLFMLGAVTRVFKPGTKFEVMLCLVGGQEPGSPPSSGSLLSVMSGFPMTCGS